MSRGERQAMSLGKHQAAVNARLAAWQKAGLARRLWAKDHTLWSEKLVPELTDRLGWLTLPQEMPAQAAALTAFAGEVKSEGVRHIVLLGMGGSSLASELFQRTFGNAAGYPRLLVLDSTHPAAVRAVEKQVELAKTLFLVSSKSGTTTELLSFFYYFWERVGRLGPQPGRHFAAITDPGTPLEKMAGERGFRRVFPAPPEVGGRYSALSVFGLVPAALIGVDVARILEQGRAAAAECAASLPEANSPALALGAALGELALAGRDKVTFFASPSFAAFPVWAEQLIAESTGKEGKGIVPVADEPAGAPAAYGDDRVFVYLQLEGEGASEVESKLAALEKAGHPVIRIAARDKSGLGYEFFRWEVATAAASVVLHVQPFDQPDVQLAKELAKKAMAKKDKAAAPAATVVSAAEPALKKEVERLLGTARPGDYLCLQAYLAPSEEAAAALERMRVKLRARTRLATTAGYGPRFLHSTGQLHKGGPNTGIFLQVVDEPAEDAAVPETSYSFGELIRAQAEGDAQALEQRGRRMLRVSLGQDAAGGLKRLEEAVAG